MEGFHLSWARLRTPALHFDRCTAPVKLSTCRCPQSESPPRGACPSDHPKARQGDVELEIRRRQIEISPHNSQIHCFLPPTLKFCLTQEKNLLLCTDIQQCNLLFLDRRQRWQVTTPRFLFFELQRQRVMIRSCWEHKEWARRNRNFGTQPEKAAT